MKDKKYFSREQIEILKPAEIHFYSCVYEQWKRGTVSTMNDLVADTYEQTTGEQLPRNWNCASCSFNNYLKVGKLYYESIERLKDQEQNTQETTTPDSTQKVDEVVEADGTLTKALWKNIDEQKEGEQLEFDFNDEEPEKPEPEPEIVEPEIEPTLIINELEPEVANTETNNTQEQKKKPGRPKKSK